jgi:thiol-disulfide isomerase/thioredoxin
MKLFRLIVLLAAFSFTTTATAQKIGDGVTIVHFNAQWNSANAVEWIDKVSECKVVKIDIAANPKAQQRHKIIVVPTLILFKDGEEIKRWQANVSFHLEEDLSEIQEEVDEQNLSDF